MEKIFTLKGTEYLTAEENRVLTYIVNKFQETISNLDESSSSDISTKANTVYATSEELYNLLNPIKVDESEDSEYLEEMLKEERINDILKKLMRYNLKIYENGKTRMFTPLTSVNFRCNIEITLNPEIIEFYRKSSEEINYTAINIEEIMSLKSVYALRMFEIMLCELSKAESVFDDNQTKNEVVYENSVEEFRRLLGVKESNYARYADFKTRVLLPSIKSIQDLGYTIEFIEIKEGKKVISLRFRFKK